MLFSAQFVEWTALRRLLGRTRPPSLTPTTRTRRSDVDQLDRRWRHHRVTWPEASAKKTTTTVSGGVLSIPARCDQDPYVTCWLILGTNDWMMRGLARDSSIRPSLTYINCRPTLKTVCCSRQLIRRKKARRYVTLPSWIIVCHSQTTSVRHMSPALTGKWTHRMMQPGPGF